MNALVLLVLFCPSGNDDQCLSGQGGMVYGVHSGFNTVINRMVGAKVPHFRDDALDRIDGVYPEE